MKPYLAADGVADLLGHDDAALVDQRISRRVRGEGVGEEQERASEKRRSEQGSGDVAPVVPGAPSKALGGLAPLRLYPVDCGQKDQDHQRDLKVEVDELEALELVDPEAVGVEVKVVLLCEQVDEAGGTDRGEEGEGQGDAAELRKHAGR